MKTLSILGSTGSIGRSTLSLVDLYPDRFRVGALAAGANVRLLAEQARRYRPEMVALCDARGVKELRGLVDVRVAGGPEGVREAAVLDSADTVVAGISGAAGLLPTCDAVRTGKRVALANKETLVMAGDLIMQAVRESGAELLPVDSEHSALHQCLRGATDGEVSRLVLTASGGPFRESSAAEIESVTVEQALNHPTWDMGPKITIDSATLMNKGLEVIEAHHLFGMPAERISVAIHPQSVVHSLVEFVDGNVLAQLSITDMRAAILYALTWPEKWETQLPRLDLFEASPLEFFPPDTSRFPCLQLAYEALDAGGTAPAVLNAANEVAVEEFLGRNLRFSEISKVIGRVLHSHRPSAVSDLETVLAVDERARAEAREAVRSAVS